MKLLRYRDSEGVVRNAAEQADGMARVATGAPFGEIEETDEVADVVEVLAPIEPTAVWAIGLNYRAHAEEAGLRSRTTPSSLPKASMPSSVPDDPSCSHACSAATA